MRIAVTLVILCLMGCPAPIGGHEGADLGGGSGEGGQAGGESMAGGAGGEDESMAGGAGGQAGTMSMDGAGGTMGMGGAGGALGVGGAGGQAELAADIYVAGLERAGERGVFSVRLVESDPIPRDTGIYTWTIEVVDANGQLVTGATLQVEPTMPAHGHGTFPRITDGTPAEGEGRYVLAELDLFMPGIWRVPIAITHADGREDVAVYRFDLEG